MRRRVGKEDHGGEWALPGGGIEVGETAEEAARRESKEETDLEYTGPLTKWTHRIKDDVDFTTFLGHIDEFEPKLNNEHDQFRWITLETALADPPTEVILHPGVRIALQRFRMDETEIAQAIRAGELTSPQRLGNILLIALRITGTGASYRKALDEYVWRDPSIYLNDHFLARCNGLFVIWEHPPKLQMLDSAEFRRRIIGTIVLPYTAGDEVWGIAKIADDDAADLLEHQKLSTSPGVVFLPWDGNRKLAFGDSVLLIEGDPSILDHLAVCELGVWDKGASASGVANGTEDTMAEEKARETRQDGSLSLEERFDRIERRLDIFDRRLDEFARMRHTDALESILEDCDAFERKDSKFSEFVEKL